MRKLTLLASLLLATSAQAADNLVLVTIDGLRWQDVFHGADPAFLANDLLTHDPAATQAFGGDSQAQRAARLMPFVSTVMAKEGSLLGDQTRGSTMEVTNPWWFSYPGYNELLTGKADPAIDSNDAKPNPNVSFLEWLNKDKAFAGRIAAFGSWDAFGAILNRDRSGLHVNAGFEPSEGYPLGEQVKLINQLQQQITSPWSSERYDAYTYPLALDYLKKQQPRVLYIALGDTDEFAHEGHYDSYLKAAHQADQYLAELWQTLQSLPQYAGNTNLVVTVDHGRGATAQDWQHHASQAAVKMYPDGEKHFPQGIVGSNGVWLAALGPDVKAKGLIPGQGKQNQVAATALALLGKDHKDFDREAGKPLPLVK